MTSPDHLTNFLRAIDRIPHSRGMLIAAAISMSLLGTKLLADSGALAFLANRPEKDNQSHLFESSHSTVTTSRVEARGGAGFESIISYLINTGQLAGTGIDSIGQFALAVREIRFYDNPQSDKSVLTNYYTSESPLDPYEAGGINDEWWVEFVIKPKPLQP